MDGQIKEINETLVKLFRYDSQEEMLSVNKLEYIAKIDRLRVVQQVSKILDSEQDEPVYCHLLRKDFSEFPAELHVSHLRDSEEKTLGVVICVKERRGKTG
jgi:PAS domain S-box-containing protein